MLLSGSTHAQHSIVVDRVTHRFGSGLIAVSDMAFRVTDGEFVVIVGPSGCGKTTILNIVAGLIEKQSGTVTIGDDPPKAGRHDIAYMFAQDALLPWRRVIDNVVFGVEVRASAKEWPGDKVHEQAREMLAAVGLAKFESAFPRQLSSGMRQRVALARTFLMPSPVLLMDEPFGALDAHTKLILEQRLIELWERDKRTVLFITHDLGEAIALADRVLVCASRPGRIKSDIRINLQRPRNIRTLQHDPRYHEHYQKIWDELYDDSTVM
jgi:NitT/TauT family transport system ATP-binding protein